MLINNADEFQMQQLTVVDPHTSTISKKDSQIKSSSRQECLNATGKTSTNVCQQACELKTSLFPSPSACLKLRLKGKAKQNRKQLITDNYVFA